MDVFRQPCPWLIALAVMSIGFVYMIYRLRKLTHELSAKCDDFIQLDREHGILQERLSSQETEGKREQENAEKQIDRLFSEHQELQGKHEALGGRFRELSDEVSSLRVIAKRLETVEREHDTTREKLNHLRKEKSDIDAIYAALQSQVEEERRSFEEQERLIKESEAAALKDKQQRIGELAEERDKIRTQLDKTLNDKGVIETDFATLQTESKERLQAADEKIKLLEQAEERLTSGFENLANRIFEEKHQKFSEVSKVNIENLLSPMRQQLTDFRKKVEDVYDAESKERTSLRTELKQLKTLNERIGTDALNLTKALQGDSKLRGNWGEMQLERLLEESGLSKGREYEVQVSLKDEEGKRFQPDMVIHLPEQKDVIIDSKVSLVAYEQYHNAEAEEEHQRQLRLHITSLRNHFKGLSAKNYDELIGVNSLDLVIMFVPIEPALLLAFEHEPNLFNEAFSCGILIVSPSTLMATLQIINNIWRYEHQNQNALQIATDAGRLHDQFVLFVEALEKVGDQIKKASESYEMAHKRLISGRGNLVGRTQKLQLLGAKTKKTLPRTLLESAINEDERTDIEILDEESIVLE